MKAVVISVFFILVINGENFGQNFVREITHVKFLDAASVDTVIAFTDKLVLLDFWATWCAPCLRKMIHLDTLKNRIGEESMVFYAITVESPERVRRFMAKGFSTGLTILLDKDSTNFRNFNITYIPQTFIIGSGGKVLWHGNSDNLSQDFLSELILTNKISQDTQLKTHSLPVPTIPQKNSNTTSLFSFSVEITDTTTSRPYATGKWRDNDNYGFLKERNNDSLLGGIGWFLDIHPSTRIETKGDIPINHNIDYSYRLSPLLRDKFSSPVMGQKYGAHFLKCMGEVLGFTFSVEQREVDAYEIELVNQEQLLSKANIENDGRYGYDDSDSSKIVISNMSLNILAFLLEKSLNVPIVLNINENYLHELKVDVMINGESFPAARESLSMIGLNLSTKRHIIPILKIEFPQ